MKFYRTSALLGLFISLVAIVPVFAHDNDSKSGEKIERTTSVDPHATITLCVASGTITVRGWDKSELRARSADVEQIELRRIDKPKDPSSPAMRIDVMVFEMADRHTKRDCSALADVEMDVPVGSTVQVQTRDGDIYIAGVAAAYAGSQNGNIDIEKATKLVEAGSVGGSISLRNSSGRINLSSAGGGVEASNIKSNDAEDSFEVGTVSGDVQLQQVTTRSLVAKTVTGNVNVTGPLVEGGNYSFGTTSGDINLYLPANASFKLNARISDKQPIESDFSLKPIESFPAPPAPAQQPTPKATPKVAPPKTPIPPREGPVVAPVVVKPAITVAPFGLRRLSVICGDGDSLITVNSFGGTLRIKKL